MTATWLHRYAVFVSAMTFVLLCAGALVTGTGSGLAVPDWPLSFGKFFPELVGGVLFEHGHRLVAGSVALFTVILCALIFGFEKRRYIRTLSACAVGAVLLQASLGGLTVLLRLPRSVSVAHACLAQLFFSITVVLVVVTGPTWQSLSLPIIDRGLPKLRHLALATSIAFFLQLMLGAIVRHNGAGLAIPDFPLAFGGIIPPEFDFKIAIHFAHRIGALTVVALTTWTAVLIFRRHPDQTVLTFWVGLLLSVVANQIMLGAMVIWLRRPVPLTTAHLAVGALCLAFSIVVTLQVYRRAWLSQLWESKMRFGFRFEVST